MVSWADRYKIPDVLVTFTAALSVAFVIKAPRVGSICVKTSNVVTMSKVCRYDKERYLRLSEKYDKKRQVIRTVRRVPYVPRGLTEMSCHVRDEMVLLVSTQLS